MMRPQSSIDPIIVTGAPYTGTSITARLLQTELGVMMDEGPIKTDVYKPMGYYEDHKLIEISKIANAYKMRKLGTNDQQVPLAWAQQFAIWLSIRNMKYKLWGFKDPGCVPVIPLMHQFFENPIWIVCVRTDKQVIKSQMKKSNYPKKVAVEALKEYKEIINREVGDVCHFMDYSKYRQESDIVKELRGILNGRI